MGLIVVQGLHLLVDGNGNNPGLSRDIPTHHKDDAEFPQGMCKGQNKGGEITAAGQGQHDIPKSIHRPCTQQGSGFDGSLAHLGEGMGQRLHHKGQRVDHGCDDQPVKGESQRGVRDGQPG